MAPVRDYAADDKLTVHETFFQILLITRNVINCYAFTHRLQSVFYSQRILRVYGNVGFGGPSTRFTGVIYFLYEWIREQGPLFVSNTNFILIYSCCVKTGG